jgi:hypothetical protein
MLHSAYAGDAIQEMSQPQRSLSENSLGGSLWDLSASVVNVFLSNLTTETQSTTEFTQRNHISRQTLSGLRQMFRFPG